MSNDSNVMWVFLGFVYVAGGISVWFVPPATAAWVKYKEFDSPGYSPDLYKGHTMARSLVGLSSQRQSWLYSC